MEILRLKLENIGRSFHDRLILIGHYVCFFYQSLTYADKKFFSQLRYSLVQQGTDSLGLMFLSSMFIGLVLALQGYVTLTRFGAEQALGQLIAMSMIRELGPVMCSLVFIGRSCTTITSELALMRIAMQIDSLEVIGINPMARLVAPRLWAVLIVAPALISIFIAVAIFSGGAISVGVLGVDYGSFWSNITSTVKFYDDVVKSLLKGLIFFFCAVAIAIYQGYFVAPRIEAVAKATTRTVVLSFALTLALDFILTSFTVH